MADDFRPSPEDLLAKVQSEEERKKISTRGKLKVFLGYAAGVGKTYTMLEAARQRRKEADVVVAYVETHGRVETDALLEGLEIIPVRNVTYRGVKLPEMDLDAVLARHPRLALVDELAHSNAPDSRHPKRYQDVEELLEAGIDVYTTLNIQHIESLRDVVAQVTNVWVRETVPDSVIDNADEIEIVDLPPDELLKRLKDGKVYVPEQIAHATARFFRKGNLTALREMTMRTAARHVDRQAQAYMEAHAIAGPWPSGERIAACISPGHLGPRLVRSARRLAYQLGAEWFAIYVETPGNTPLSPYRQDRLSSTMRLAERMGAKAVTVRADSVAKGIREFAAKNNITKVVIGQSRHSRLRELLGISVLSQVIRQSAKLDVYVVTGGAERHGERPGKTTGKVALNWWGYLQGLGIVVLASWLGQLMQGFFARGNLLMIYLLCVTVAAISWGFGPSILVSILSVLAFNLLFVPPFFKIALGDTQYLLTLATFLLVGFIISYLTARVRRQTEAARRRESETAALYALSRDLTVSNDLYSYIRAIVTRMKETFGRETIIFIPDRQNSNRLNPYPADAPVLDEKELAAARWCFEHQKVIGRGTDTLPNSRAKYVPLITARGVVAVMALWSADGAQLTRDQEQLLDAYADLDALAIEGILLSLDARDTQILREGEKLQTAFLNSISQDLRTPMLSIIGTLNRLEESAAYRDEETRQLVRAGCAEAETLNHMITNLLDQSRIDGGAVHVTKRPSDLQDVLTAALERLAVNPDEGKVSMDVPADLPAVPLDFGLIVQALVNILDNSFKYSRHGSPVEVAVRIVNQMVQVEVADRGIGIPPEDLERVFDKFYRVQRPDNVIGTGLGLSICKGFVEAHGGRVWAENRPGGGTVVKLALPLT